MPQVHQIGKKHFAHLMKYPHRHFPLIERGSTQEIEEPFRVGRSIVFRAPLSTGCVVLGRWYDQLDEEQALAAAIGMRPLDVA